MSDKSVSQDNLTDVSKSEIISKISGNYECPICQMVFDNPNSLKMHAMKSHRVRLDAKGGPLSPSSVEIQAPASPVSDLIEMTPEMKKAVEFSRWKERLRQSDPNLYKIFFPEEARKEESVSKELAYLELARLLRQMRQEEQMSQPQPQPIKAEYNNHQAQTQQLIQTYESKISELQKQIEGLREELTKREIQSLQEKLKEFEGKLEKVREEALTGKSELASVLNVLSKHLEGLGSKLEDFAAFYVFRMIPTTWLEKFGLKMMPEKVIEKEATVGLWEKINKEWVSEK